LSIRIKLLSLNKKYYFFLILFLSFVLCEGRGQNLIKNGGFEAYINPPNWNSTGGGFFDYSFFPEHRIVLDWEVFNSPDYFNVVCSGTYRGVPINTFGTSHPNKGNAYGGIYVFNKGGETKEYIYQQLSSPLKTDSVYCVSFFSTRGDRMPYAIKNLGAYFSVNVPTLTTNYIDAIPQVTNQTAFITDTVDWTEIQGCFTALGGEEYITIGNFNSNANTDTLRIQSTNPLTGPGTDIAYYYIDSVSLWRNNFPTGINETGNKNSLVVYPNPANDLLNFQFPKAEEKRKVELYDAIGNLVLSENASADKLFLTTRNLPNGIYFYRILVKGKIINTNKIVIIK
jgi:hypothetical protein